MIFSSGILAGNFFRRKLITVAARVRFIRHHPVRIVLIGKHIVHAINVPHRVGQSPSIVVGIVDIEFGGDDGFRGGIKIALMLEQKRRSTGVRH